VTTRSEARAAVLGYLKGRGARRRHTPRRVCSVWWLSLQLRLSQPAVRRALRDLEKDGLVLKWNRKTAQGWQCWTVRTRGRKA